MEDRTPELEDVIRAASLPARVVKFAPGTRPTVTCQPFPSDLIDGEPVDLPVLAGVPVVYPQGKGGAITWPLQADDVVLVVFAARPLGRYRSEGAEGDPRQVRHHSLSDAWAIPLGAGNADVPGDDNNAVWTAPTGGKIRLGAGGAAVTKAVARKDDPVGAGALSLTCAAGGGGVILSLSYTPPGGVPNVQTALITGALGAGVGGGVPASLQGTITAGSGTVEAV
jgi:hypothetical protein